MFLFILLMGHYIDKYSVSSVLLIKGTIKASTCLGKSFFFFFTVQHTNKPRSNSQSIGQR